MIFAGLYLVISFILDGYMSLVFNYDLYSFCLFKTMYTLIALVILWEKFANKKKCFYLFILFGILSDVVYSNTLLLNVFLYGIIFYLVCYLDYLIPTNAITIGLKTYCCIVVYHGLTYFILLLTSNIYPAGLLLKILLENILVTIIYSVISYLIVNRLFLDKAIK